MYEFWPPIRFKIQVSSIGMQVKSTLLNMHSMEINETQIIDMTTAY